MARSRQYGRNRVYRNNRRRVRPKRNVRRLPTVVAPVAPVDPVKNSAWQKYKTRFLMAAAGGAGLTLAGVYSRRFAESRIPDKIIRQVGVAAYNAAANTPKTVRRMFSPGSSVGAVRGSPDNMSLTTLSPGTGSSYSGGTLSGLTPLVLDSPSPMSTVSSFDVPLAFLHDPKRGQNRYFPTSRTPSVSGSRRSSKKYKMD